MTKSLDTKIADILANPSGSKAFIIADAKDADMAFGVAAPGPRRAAKTNDYESDWKTLEDFRAPDSRRRPTGNRRYHATVSLKRRDSRDGGEAFRELCGHARGAARTIPPISGPCAVANTRAKHRGRFARRHSTISYGCIDPKPNEKIVGADLGLYSITFTNNLDEEHYALREFPRNFDWRPSGRVFAISSKCSIPTSSLGFLKRIFQPSSTTTSFALWQASRNAVGPFSLKSLTTGRKRFMNWRATIPS